MLIEDYKKKALKCLQPNLKNNNEELVVYGCIGLAGEVGELINKLKKIMYHQNYIEGIDKYYQNKDDLILEIGDIMFYIISLTQAIGIDFNDCLIKNLEKIEKRHGKSYNSKSYYK